MSSGVATCVTSGAPGAWFFTLSCCTERRRRRWLARRTAASRQRAAVPGQLELDHSSEWGMRVVCRASTPGRMLQAPPLQFCFFERRWRWPSDAAPLRGSVAWEACSVPSRPPSPAAYATAGGTITFRSMTASAQDGSLGGGLTIGEQQSHDLARLVRHTLRRRRSAAEAAKERRRTRQKLTGGSAASRRSALPGAAAAREWLHFQNGSGSCG